MLNRLRVQFDCSLRLGRPRDAAAWRSDRFWTMRSAAVLRSRFCATNRPTSDISLGSSKRSHHWPSTSPDTVRLGTSVFTGPQSFGACTAGNESPGRTGRLSAEYQGAVTRLGDRACPTVTSSSPAWIVVSTGKPTRNSLASGWLGLTRILTGRRCTILVKLPVALLEGIWARRSWWLAAPNSPRHSG